MSVIRYYFDNDSSISAVVRALRDDLIDVQIAREVGLHDAKDPLQVEHVLTTGRVLITGDNRLRSRMENLSRQRQHHPGLLFLQSQLHNRIGPILETLRLIHAACSAEEMVDQVRFIPF